MPEYLYTNLPQYIRVTPRSAFANSVVQNGSVLLFSEDGTTLTAKLPDGSFITVGGSGGTDVSDTTATAATVLSGYDFYNASGVKTTGSIQTVTASQSGNVVTVPAGYIAAAQTLTVGTAKAAATYTPTTSDQTITAGQYLTGDQTIKGDANLVAANIVSGVTIFGVTGTASGGGSTDFYKCATVSGPYTETYYVVSGAGMAAVNGNYTDTGTTSSGKPVYSYTNSGTTYYLFYDSVWEGWFIHTSTTFTTDYAMDECLYYKRDWNESWYAGGGGSGDPPSVTLTTVTHDLPKTWTGYKAVYDSVTGTYSFEQTATSDLTWTDIKPQVGGIYSADTKIIASYILTAFPTDGLVFHASLSSSSATCESGQTLTPDGANISYQTYKGIPCVRVYNGSFIKVLSGLNLLPVGSAPFTMSVWALASSISEEYGKSPFGYKGNGTGIWFDGIWDHDDGGPRFISVQNMLGTGIAYSVDTWYHVCITFDGTMMSSYVNGIAGNTVTPTMSSGDRQIFIGGNIEGIHNFNGYIAGCRIYNRALLPVEVTQLAAEFTPNA